MDANDIIRNSMNGASQMVMGSNLYALEGNIPENRYRILSLKDACIDAMMCFQYSIESNNVILGVFNSEEAAEYFRTMVQTLYRDERGNTIL